MDANERKILEDAGVLFPTVVTNADRIRCPLCGGTLSEIRTDGKHRWRHCYSCHMEQEVKE